MQLTSLPATRPLSTSRLHWSRVSRCAVYPLPATWLLSTGRLRWSSARHSCGCYRRADSAGAECRDEAQCIHCPLHGCCCRRADSAAGKPSPVCHRLHSTVHPPLKQSVAICSVSAAATTRLLSTSRLRCWQAEPSTSSTTQCSVSSAGAECRDVQCISCGCITAAVDEPTPLEQSVAMERSVSNCPLHGCCCRRADSAGAECRDGAQYIHCPTFRRRPRRRPRRPRTSSTTHWRLRLTDAGVVQRTSCTAVYIQFLAYYGLLTAQYVVDYTSAITPHGRRG